MMIRMAARLMTAASCLSGPSGQCAPVKRDIFSDAFLCINVFAEKRSKAVKEFGDMSIPQLAASVDALDPGGGFEEGIRSVKGAIYLAQDKQSLQQTGELVKAFLSRYQVLLVRLLKLAFNFIQSHVVMQAVF